MRRTSTVALIALALFLPTAGIPSTAQAATADHVVIEEAYLNGGSTGAVYKNKYVELYNPTDAAVSLAGWSLQYRAYNSTSAASVASLSGSIPAKGSYLIAGTANSTNGADWTTQVTPDATASASWSGNANGGTLLLASTTTALNPAAGSVVSDSDEIVDLFGYTKSNTYETTVESAAGSVTTAFARTDGIDTDNNDADFSAVTTFVPTNSAGTSYSAGGGTDPQPPVSKTISEIQGTGAASPLVGTTVVTTGFVTAVYSTGGFKGYVIESAGAGATLDDSSDALFVYSPDTVASVAIGDYVQLTGSVSEYSGLTELSVAAGGLTKPDATGLTPPAPAKVSWPATDAARESLESMLVEPQGDFTVTDTYDTNYYGSVVLASGKTPLITPGEIAEPGTTAYTDAAADNAARMVTLDDGASINFSSSANSSIPLPYLSLDKPVRVGEPVTFVHPVIVDYRFSAWNFQPTSQLTAANADTVQPVTFTNTRTAAPEVATSRLRIASFNVLNYFTTTGADAEKLGATCTYYDDREGNHITVNTCNAPSVRGAADAVSFARQQAKIVAAINALSADVVSLEEIENSSIVGDRRDAAVSALVDALNAAAGTTRWAYAPSPMTVPSSEDVIRTAFIYNPATIELVGPSVISTDTAFAKARYPLAQTFRPVGEDANAFVVIANHFKSKGSCPTDSTDVNADHGQGCWNPVRTDEANALVSFADARKSAAQTDKVFLIGDLNAYTQEDPVRALTAAGYIDQGSKTGKYSYSFDNASGSLDHILASPNADKLITGRDIWNINSGESVALEYSRYNYNALNLYDASPYRSSDHDPVIVGYSPAKPDVPTPTVTTTSLKLSKKLVGYGTAVTATATVTGATSGTVRFGFDGRTLEAAISGGRASVTLPADLNVGSYPVTAAFLGTADAAASAATPVTLRVKRATVTPINPKVKLTVKRGAAVNFTVHTLPLGVGIWATGTLVTKVNGKVVRVNQLLTRGTATVRLARSVTAHLKRGHSYRLVTVLERTGNTSAAVLVYGTLRVR